MPLCFHCKKEITTINEGFLGDVRCPSCKILNSFYGSDDNIPEDKPDTTEEKWLNE